MASKKAAADKTKPKENVAAEETRRLAEENTALRENLALLEELRSRLAVASENLVMLNRIGQELNTLDLDKIADIAVTKIPALVAAKYCSLYLYDYGNDELKVRAHNHPNEIAPNVLLREHPNTVMGLVLQRKKAIHIVDFRDFEQQEGVRLERAFASKYATPTCISAPLMAGNYTVGILNCADKVDGSFFDEMNDLPMIEQLARVLGMAIRNCNLFREVQKQARTDGMTKLPNYRAFHETLRREMHRSMRYSRPLGLLMIDVDGFKEINDKLGHPGGDYILSELGSIVKNTLRNEDHPSRYGGDEIAVILPETAGPGMMVVANRLLNLVRQYEFKYNGARVPVTLSIGAATFRPEQSITDFVATADEALYRAKQDGRNRVESAPLPE